MQILERTPRLNVRAVIAIPALSSLFLFATCLIGYNPAHADGRGDAPTFESAQDVSGTWLGQLSEKLDDGRVGHGNLYLRLEQSGVQVSGVAGESKEAASPIVDAVLSGEHLKFSISNGGVLLKMELDANGDSMEGKGHAVRTNDNHSWDFEIKLTRSK